MCQCAAPQLFVDVGVLPLVRCQFVKSWMFLDSCLNVKKQDGCCEVCFLLPWFSKKKRRGATRLGIKTNGC